MKIPNGKYRSTVVIRDVFTGPVSCTDARVTRSRIAARPCRFSLSGLKDRQTAVGYGQCLNNNSPIQNVPQLIVILSVNVGSL